MIPAEISLRVDRRLALRACNVGAGTRHDPSFVPAERAVDATPALTIRYRRAFRDRAASWPIRQRQSSSRAASNGSFRNFVSGATCLKTSTTPA